MFFYSSCRKEEEERQRREEEEREQQRQEEERRRLEEEERLRREEEERRQAEEERLRVEQQKYVCVCVCIMCVVSYYIELTSASSSHSPDTDIHRVVLSFSVLELWQSSLSRRTLRQGQHSAKTKKRQTSYSLQLFSVKTLHSYIVCVCVWLWPNAVLWAFATMSVDIHTHWSKAAAVFWAWRCSCSPSVAPPGSHYWMTELCVKWLEASLMCDLSFVFIQKTSDWCSLPLKLMCNLFDLFLVAHFFFILKYRTTAVLIARSNTVVSSLTLQEVEHVQPVSCHHLHPS